MVSKRNQNKIALFQVSELLLFTQIYDSSCVYDVCPLLAIDTSTGITITELWFIHMILIDIIYVCIDQTSWKVI